MVAYEQKPSIASRGPVHWLTLLRPASDSAGTFRSDPDLLREYRLFGIVFYAL